MVVASMLVFLLLCHQLVCRWGPPSYSSTQHMRPAYPTAVCFAQLCHSIIISKAFALCRACISVGVPLRHAAERCVRQREALGEGWLE